MAGAVILVLFIALVSWTMAAGITSTLFKESKVSRGTTYFITIVVAVAVSALIGLGIEVPEQSPQETAFRALLIILLPALLGVRMALGRKPITH